MVQIIKNDISKLEELRRNNVRAVLATLRASKLLSRTDIARLSGLSAATVSTIISSLIDDGYVTPVTLEEDQKALRRGRPQVVLALEPQAAKVATVALSLNAATVAIYDYSGEQIAVQEFETDTRATKPAMLVDWLAQSIKSICNQNAINTSNLNHIAMGFQGVADVARRRMIWAPITTGSVDFASELESFFSVPAIVSNDCDMIAVAIANERNPAFGSDFAVVTLSRGIGMAIIRNGQVITGLTSSAAEFGHIVYRHEGAKCRCGQTGCIEAYAGDYAIWRFSRGEDENVLPHEYISREDFADLFTKARRKDGRERRAFARAGKALGVGLRSVFAMLDQLPVIFVGFGAMAAEILEPEIRNANAKSSIPTNPAELILDWRKAARPLIIEGCALTALGAIDDAFANGAGTTRLE